LDDDAVDDELRVGGPRVVGGSVVGLPAVWRMLALLAGRMNLVVAARRDTRLSAVVYDGSMRGRTVVCDVSAGSAVMTSVDDDTSLVPLDAGALLVDLRALERPTSKRVVLKEL